MMASTRAAAILLSIPMAALVGVTTPAGAAYDTTPSTRWEPDAPVQAIAVFDDVVYIGGAFTALTDASTGDRVLVGHVAALDASSGELVRSWDVSADAPVTAIAVSADGSQVFLGGDFANVNDTPQRRLVAVDASDGEVVSGWRGSASGRVNDLLVVGQRVYVAGGFHALNGIADRFLGALDATTGARVPGFRAVANDPAYGLATSGEQLYVAGKFTRVNAAVRPQLAAVDRTSGALSGWHPPKLHPSCETVWDVATDGQRVYAGASGPGGRLVALDSVTGAVAWRVRADGDIQAVSVADGLVYAGGHFGNLFGGEERKQLAAVRAVDGAVDPAFAPKMYNSYPGVKALAATPAGLYAGGHFGGAGAAGRSPYLAAFRSS